MVLSIFLSCAFAPASAEANTRNTEVVRKRMPKQLKKKNFCVTFLLFFRARRPNRQKAPQMTSQIPLGPSRGPSRRPKSIHFSLQGRSKAAKIIFWDAPGRARASPGRLRGASGSRFGPKGRPEASRELFWSIFGAILEPFWLPCLTPPALHFGTSVVMYFPHVCSLCFSSFYNALRSNQAATKQAKQAKQSN